MPIRRATVDDAAGISRLLTALGYPDTDALLPAALATMLKDPAEFLLVWDDPSSPHPVVGFLSLHRMRMIGRLSNYLHINYFVIDEKARGKDIGTEMEREAVRIARENDCSHIALHCHTDRIAAQTFYTHRGYIESPKYLIKKL